MARQVVGIPAEEEDLLTQNEKIPEPLLHPYIAAPQLHDMSWPQTCALDVEQTRDIFPLSLRPKLQRVRPSGLEL